VPAATPMPEMPTLDAPPPVAEGGMATVIIDTNVPARVERVMHGTAVRRAMDLRDLLCVETPCTVTLPYGDHELYFSSTHENARPGTVIVSVKHATEVVNHALAVRHYNYGQTIGALVLALGVGAALVGGAFARGGNGDASKAAAPAIVFGGIATAIGGLVIIGLTPGTIEESATTQWTPVPAPETAKTVGGSLGFRF
jgi:hypothetical protein